ncbi:MAG TPA: MBL fold metallo-hydrolase, partial [Candidatus Acidoferrales bacterium]|nr:MBL fold metallo-hydrolase [Candidatus Acidoferrales bacterium]
MIDFNRGNYETAGGRSDRQTVHSAPFSRRSFLAKASYFGALYATAKLLRMPALAAELAGDARVSQTPIVDKGFASVRKIGEGLYATISDPSKGFQTVCNGGFLVGKDGALLIEGFISAPGAAFQMDALRTVSQVPVKVALDTHYHFDHSMGNAFYGSNGIPLWAHANTAKRIVESYGALQGVDKAAFLGPIEKAIKEAKTETARKHREGNLALATNLYNVTNSTVLALPNHPIDPAKLPMKVDLGGVTAVIESYPGHSGTDVIVRVPEQNVVYTGDLLFSGMYPVCFDAQATVSGWRQTLKTFASWNKDTLFVPGHGPICGQEGIALSRALFDNI